VVRGREINGKRARARKQRSGKEGKMVGKVVRKGQGWGKKKVVGEEEGVEGGRIEGEGTAPSRRCTLRST